MFRSGNDLPEWFITALNLPTVPGYLLESVEIATVDSAERYLKAVAVYENPQGAQQTRCFLANGRQIEKLVKLLHIPKGCVSVKLNIATGCLVQTTVTSYLALPDTTSFNRSLIWTIGEEHAT